MKYILLHIPCRTFSNKTIELNEGIVCFKSNQSNTFSSFYNRCIGLIIDVDKNENYIKVISDFILTLNIFHQEYTSIQWLSQLDTGNIIQESNSEIDELIKPFISEYNNTIDGYLENFEKMQMHVVV